jgi:hypothetical protein
MALAYPNANATSAGREQAQKVLRPRLRYSRLSRCQSVAPSLAKVLITLPFQAFIASGNS